MKHAKIKAAEDEREQLEEEINSLRTDLRLARSNTKIYGEKERGKEFSPMIEVPNFRLDQWICRVASATQRLEGASLNSSIVHFQHFEPSKMQRLFTA